MTVITVSLTILCSAAGTGAIIFKLSNWLGKVWANKILEQDKARYNKEIEILKNGFNKDLEFYKSQIELSKLTLSRYSEGQFNLYSRLWSTLAGLKIAGDKLWDKVDKGSLLEFSTKLKLTKEEVSKNALLIEDAHEQELILLLTHFGEYEIGKYKLAELYGKNLRGSKNFWPDVITALQWHDIVQENDARKKAYDKLLSLIKDSFKKQLKNGL